MSHPNDPDEIEIQADALTWAVLKHLAIEIPDLGWLSDETDGAVVATHRPLSRDVVRPFLEGLQAKASEDLFSPEEWKELAASIGIIKGMFGAKGSDSLAILTNRIRVFADRAGNRR